MWLLMDIVKVQGKDKRHKVFVYALSTCAWCKKTKRFLEENGVEYEYVDVDRCNAGDLEKIKSEISSKGLPLSFPLVIIDEKTFITGFREDKISEALKA
jgi:glutaredoxin